LRHDRSQILFVLVDRHLVLAVDVFEVVQAPVEMNRIPLSVAEPGFEILDAIRGRPAVDRDAMHIRLPGEQLANRQRVAHRNRIADQQHSRQTGDIGDFFERRIRLLRGGLLFRRTGTFARRCVSFVLRDRSGRSTT
jgi:hypothetical protein